MKQTKNGTRATTPTNGNPSLKHRISLATSYNQTSVELKN